MTSGEHLEAIRRLLPRKVCWRRLRAWCPVIVLDAAARVLRQPRRPAPAAAVPAWRRTGVPLWK